MKHDRSKKKQALAAELNELSHLAEGPIDGGRLEKLRDALRSHDNQIVARAAAIIRERRLDGFAPDLLAAFERFQDHAQKSDHGCVAKLAAIEALDFMDHPDPRPFLVAARTVQLEPAWGPPVDTAAPLRARAILALANLGYDDILLLAGELLADPQAAVRTAAAEALAHCGSRAGAGLLLLASHGSEEDPLVKLAYLSGLLTLAPDWSLPHLRKLLFGDDATLRELAATALGQSRRDDALDLLLDFVQESPIASERAVILTAMGLHRSDHALQSLLETITSGRTADAAAAVKALAARRFEPRVVERVREAVEQADATVERAFTDAFREDD